MGLGLRVPAPIVGRQNGRGFDSSHNFFSPLQHGCMLPPLLIACQDKSDRRIVKFILTKAGDLAMIFGDKEVEFYGYRKVDFTFPDRHGKSCASAKPKLSRHKPRNSYSARATVLGAREEERCKRRCGNEALGI